LIDFDIASLRERLKRPLPASAVYGDDGIGREASGTVAAVLVPIIAHPSGLTVLFTQRTAHLKAHSGQVSFPGGRAEPSDRSAEETALRESEEEIGLDRARVTVAGALPPTPTFVTNYAIYPFVGLIEAGREWVIGEDEVAEVLELPLAALRSAYGERRLVRRGIPFRTPTYEVEGHFIWGATGRILKDLLARVS